VHRQLFQIRNFIDGKLVEPAGGEYLDNIRFYLTSSESRWMSGSRSRDRFRQNSRDRAGQAVVDYVFDHAFTPVPRK
jgi:hypothetical protein